MKNQEEINNEIEETLHSLDGISSAEPKPFFYTRLKARMENTQAQLPRELHWVLRPAVLFSTLALIVVINVASVINYTKHSSVLGQPSSEQSLRSFSNEFDLSDSN